MEQILLNPIALLVLISMLSVSVVCLTKATINLNRAHARIAAELEHVQVCMKEYERIHWRLINQCEAIIALSQEINDNNKNIIKTNKEILELNKVSNG